MPTRDCILGFAGRVFLFAWLHFGMPAAVCSADGLQRPSENRLYRAGDAIELRVNLSAASSFVGEGVFLELQWRSRLPWQSFRNVEIDLPILRSPDFDRKDCISQPSKGEKVGLPLAKTRVLANASSSRGKNDWRTLSFSTVLAPRKAGEYEIDGVELRCAVLPQGSRAAQAWAHYPSYFDNNFFEREVPDEASLIRAAAEPLNLKVENLPVDSAASNVLAVCSHFTPSLDAQPRSVAVGDPIDLRLRIAGDAIPESVGRPQLGRILESSAFEVDPAPRTPEYEKDAVVFKYLLRAVSTAVEEIPPIELIYFDKASQSCKRVETAALPLQVSPAPKIGLEDAVRPDERPRWMPGIVWICLALAALAATCLIIFRPWRRS